MKESETWRTTMRLRALHALQSASAPADRLALLRDLVRLGDGYFSLEEAGMALSAAERSLLHRFRLIESGGGSALIPAAVGDFPWSKQLALDTGSRRIFSPAVPDTILLRLSPHTAYQTDTQKSAVRALIAMPPASTLIVSMPTGSGKSLLFEVAPKWWLSNGRPTSVAVIVPTIALALDHERTLSAFPGLERSRALTSQLSLVERENVLNAFRRGEIPILLLSPEMAMGVARSTLLEVARPREQKAAQLKGELSSVFVDEAHIIETWGRTFRPEFQRIPALVTQLRANNPDLRVVLLSATINTSARQELRRAYTAQAVLEIGAGAPRYEFDIAVKWVPTESERDKLIFAAVDQVPRPTILYTTRVDHARQLYEELRDRRSYGRLALFTGEIESPSERARIIDGWARDQIDLVIATSAFGMGVDKRNVRSVLHACLPEGAPRYYQEIGRAARDGHQGLAIAIWFQSNSGAHDDEDLALSQATRQWLTRELAADRWTAIVRRLAGQEGQLWDNDTGKRILRIALDSAHDGIVRGQSNYNRRWNMSLLNLMQRAGAITIRASDDKGNLPFWEALVERSELLSDHSESSSVWNEIFQLRKSEKANAVREVTSFRDILVSPESGCLLQGIFELIEPEADIIEPCGRCPRCRDAGIPPPKSLHSGGLDRVWPTPPSWANEGKLPAGIILIHPQYNDFSRSLGLLLERLVSTGTEQFIVPDGLGCETAQQLKGTTVQAGFVLEWQNIISGAEPVDVPTAALLSGNSYIEPYVDFLQAWAEIHPRQTIVVCAGPGLLVHNRPLEQILSKIAPYDEQHLDRIAIREHAS